MNAPAPARPPEVEVPRRWRSLDAVRGCGILLMVVLHGALYHYGALAQVDLERPPLVVVAIGFLLMWGGLFAVLSGAAHAVRAVEHRRRQVSPWQWCRWEWLAAAGYLGLGVAYFTLVGPGLLDLARGTLDSSVVVGWVLSGAVRPPSLDRLLYVNTLYMVGIATLFVAPVTAWLLARHGTDSRALRRAVALLAVLALLSSALRIPLYAWYERAAAEGRTGWLVASFWLVNKNDPFWPSVGLALCGTLLGLTMSEAPRAGRLRLPLAIGAALVAGGVAGWALGPPSMLRRGIDQTWFAIVLLQAGVIQLGLCGVHRLLDAPAGRDATAFQPGRVERTLQRFARMSLSVLFGEAVLAAAVARVLGLVWPGWNLGIPAALLFGLGQAAAWALLLAAWERRDYRGSLERGWVHVMARVGRPSTRMAAWPR